jgi:RNA polymerase sigma-70 factor (ECF subfamily)
MQLVEAYRRGDAGALGELIRAYQRRVYAICCRMVRHPADAADLAQDALVRVIEGLPGYDGRAALSTWIIRVTMNCCISHLRRQKPRRHQSLDELPPDAPIRAARGFEPGGRPGREHPPEAGVEREELRAILLEALRQLDPAMRAVLVLRDLQNLDYREIGEVLDIPAGTVKSRLFRARAALRAEAERRQGRGADQGSG